jgi:hypothetical protein
MLAWDQDRPREVIEDTSYSAFGSSLTCIRKMPSSNSGRGH